MAMMRISELAHYSGVPETTLRFYDSAGLLPAQRTSAGQRVYEPQSVERLAVIGAARNLGLSLEDIGGLSAVDRGGAGPAVEPAPRVRARLDRAEARLTDLTEFIDSLRAALRHIDEAPAGAGG